MNFNKSQQEAILHKDGPMLVLAGPGSGKTAVITQRTLNFIDDHHVNPANILVIRLFPTIIWSIRMRMNLSERFLERSVR